MPDVTVGATAAYLAVPFGPAGPLEVSHDVKVYPEAGHSFMSPKPAAMKPLIALARLTYDKAAAEDAWQRIFAFFGTYLK